MIELPDGIKEKQLPEMLWLMTLAREIELREESIKKQGKGWFQIGGRGHEALVGVALALEKGKDYSYAHYRDRWLALALGQTSRDMFLAFFGKADDPNSRGRQMPSHYNVHQGRNVSMCSAVGTQFIPGAGTAMACRRKGLGEAVLITCGDGTTSEGEFYEAVRIAVIDRAPALFLVEDNRYAISTPTSAIVAYKIPHSTATDPSGQEWFLGARLDRIDGTDPLLAYAAARRALDRARRGEGPTVLVADTVRLSPHSSADPHYLYRSETELAEDARRDPVLKFAALLVAAGVLPQDEVERMQKRAFAQVQDDADWAEAQADPDPSTALDYLYAPIPDDLPARDAEPPHPGRLPDRKKGLDMVAAIKLALEREMERNPAIHVFGEDVADPKGGVFGVTKGLTDRFGDRVLNSPLAEATVLGTAVGMAVAGFLPVYEIQFIDYFDPGTQMWKAQVTTLHWRSAGTWKCPMVIRSSYGGYLPAGGPWHSQSNESLFAHLPGAFIAIPSTPADAYGLLVYAMRCNNPVLFLEPKHLYHTPREEFMAEPPADYVIPFGKASIRRSGSHVTLVTWGNCVYESLEAAAEVAREDGVEVEVIDLRTIVPCDEEAIVASLGKTGRLMVVAEDTRTCGFAAEILARVTERPEVFELLDAYPVRVVKPDIHIPYAPGLERATLPHRPQVVAAIRKLAAY
jgi:2-oxoisovalerate dehydrogenase E1 component